MTNDTSPHEAAEERRSGRRRKTRRFSALAVVVAMAVSGSGVVALGAAASASSKTTTTVTKKSLKKFESCLKQHGVKTPFAGAGGPPEGSQPSGTVPSGGGAPGGFKGSPKTLKAMKACSHLLPAGSGFGSPPGSSTGASSALAAFRNCMTLNHVTLAKGAYGNTKSSTNVTATTSATYKKAYSSCSTLLPKGTPTKG